MHGSLASFPSGLNTNGVSLTSIASMCAAYSKKDVTLHHDGQETCVRIQLWDVNMNLPTVLASSESIASMASMEAPNAQLSSLLNKCNGFLLIIRAPSKDPDGTDNHSLASYSYASINTAYQWPELDLVLRKIEGWISFLRGDETSENTFKPISILLTHADEIISSYSPRNWMELSSRISSICFDRIDWKLGCCVDSNNTDDESHDAHNHAGDSNELLQRLKFERRRMLEDMENAVELAFVDLVKSCLNHGPPKMEMTGRKCF